MNLGHGQRRSVLILWLWTALLSAFVLYPVFTTERRNAGHARRARAWTGLFTVLHPEVAQESCASCNHGDPITSRTILSAQMHDCRNWSCRERIR